MFEKPVCIIFQWHLLMLVAQKHCKEGVNVHFIQQNSFLSHTTSLMNVKYFETLHTYFKSTILPQTLFTLELSKHWTVL